MTFRLFKIRSGGVPKKIEPKKSPDSEQVIQDRMGRNVPMIAIKSELVSGLGEARLTGPEIVGWSIKKANSP